MTETDDKPIILAVDDEKSNLTILKKILSPEYTVLTARSGEEGLRTAHEQSVDLVLLDAMMPDMDGFQVLVRLKEDHDTQDIPALIMTGASGKNDEERGFFLGAVDYISKPFKNSIVKARVRTHIKIVHQLRAIERLGLIDSLTDIPNRRSFDDRLEVEWRRCVRKHKAISFLMMDLDNFKIYNDIYGHTQGDAMLQTVAKLLAGMARRPGDMAARLGGEKFGVLFPDTDLKNALNIAEKIRGGVESLAIPATDGQSAARATISIGAASAVPDEDDHMRDLIARADEYLYAAKAEGKNRVVTRDHVN